MTSKTGARILLIFVLLCIFETAAGQNEDILYTKAVFSYDCTLLRAEYGEIPSETDCLFNGALIDVNGNNTPDEQDTERLDITEDFGRRNRLNRYHSGIDISVTDNSRITGNAVFSPVSGVIAAYGYANDGYGYRVVVYNSGYYYIFAHLYGSRMESARLVYIGKEIQPGDIVGYYGGCENRTNGVCPPEYNGSSTGEHLHFEVRKCGEDSCAAVQDPIADPLAADGTVCKWYSRRE